MSQAHEHTPEVDQLIRSVMDKHQRLHQMGAYYEDVHQWLAPLARKLELQRDELVGMLSAARAWISDSPHGDDCFVSDHYEGDPGARCNCGKDSMLSAIDAAITNATKAEL